MVSNGRLMNAKWGTLSACHDLMSFIVSPSVTHSTFSTKPNRPSFYALKEHTPMKRTMI